MHMEKKKIEAHLGIVGASIRRDSDLRAIHHQTRSNKFKIQLKVSDD